MVFLLAYKIEYHIKAKIILYIDIAIKFCRFIAFLQIAQQKNNIDVKINIGKMYNLN